ncbi:MAG TPA: 2-oxoglutarate dehydrogenase complex dihydrolipoyllysine-residue succinyltransferase [Vicinamibacterales bacterium]|nr:2-oxoglutarate dehydrogenase complex dihydrolipoyllysine-residue succinyltransferase [Vicinamibacterales bacterium]
MSNIVVPELGESVVEARIARWLKKPGDRVEVGEAVVELETEKIDLEVSAEKGGVIASIARQEGDDVKIGELLAVVDESAAAAAPAAAPEPKAAAKPAAEASNGSANGSPADDARATPTARRVAKDHDVNLGTVQGSGSAGRVMKQDVQAALAGPAEKAAAKPAAVAAKAPAPDASPAPAAAKPAGIPAGSRGETRVRMTKRRETIARRLVEAQHNAAMLTTFNEVDMTAVMALRERQKESFKKRYGINLGIASFFVKAAVAALKAFPQLNAEIQGNEIVYKPYYDIGMAVGAEGGLVVPVLRNTETMAFAAVETAIREYAKKAADSTLTLEDLAGGTFTITNGGVFGSLLSTPILNPPQVAILGLHKIQDRAVAVGGQVVIRPMMYVALSYDHRIVDGREAVQFLVKIKEFIEDPGHLLLES